MSIRAWITLITIFLLGLVVYFGWPQIVQAWGLMDRVNPWILVLLLPVQLFSYYSGGEAMFSYLRAKNELKDMSRSMMARISLELNFVNHIFPLPGAGGFSYMGWVMGHHGVSAGRTTMAQIIRIFSQFVSFVMFILISVLVLLFDNGASRVSIFISTLFVVATILLILFTVYVIGNRKRVILISAWVAKTVNNIMRRVTNGKKQEVVKPHKIKEFFLDLHSDYVEIKADKKILIRPLIWSSIGNVLDVGLILIAFLSLGFWVNPAALFVAYGVASFATIIFSVMPGGSGVYETIMITFLASAGVPAEVAIAGTLLARAILLTGTILFGYIFYQLTINKYGKITNSANI